jgi:hypothetical protein
MCSAEKLAARQPSASALPVLDDIADTADISEKFSLRSNANRRLRRGHRAVAALPSIDPRALFETPVRPVREIARQRIWRAVPSASSGVDASDASHRTSQKRFPVSVLTASPISATDLAELASCGDDGARSQFLARHAEFADPAIVEQIADAVREQVRVDVHKADALADAAVLIARGIDSPATIARALRAKANAKWHLNELKSAVDLFDQAIELFDLAGDQAELGRTLSSSIQSLILALLSFPAA